MSQDIKYIKTNRWTDDDGLSKAIILKKYTTPANQLVYFSIELQIELTTTIASFLRIEGLKGGDKAFKKVTCTQSREGPATVEGNIPGLNPPWFDHFRRPCNMMTNAMTLNEEDRVSDVGPEGQTTTIPRMEVYEFIILLMAMY